MMRGFTDITVHTFTFDHDDVTGIRLALPSQTSRKLNRIYKQLFSGKSDIQKKKNYQPCKEAEKYNQ